VVYKGDEAAGVPDVGSFAFQLFINFRPAEGELFLVDSTENLKTRKLLSNLDNVGSSRALKGIKTRHSALVIGLKIIQLQLESRML